MVNSMPLHCFCHAHSQNCWLFAFEQANTAQHHKMENTSQWLHARVCDHRCTLAQLCTYYTATLPNYCNVIGRESNEYLESNICHNTVLTSDENPPEDRRQPNDKKPEELLRCVVPIGEGRGVCIYTTTCFFAAFVPLLESITFYKYNIIIILALFHFQIFQW